MPPRQDQDDPANTRFGQDSARQKRQPDEPNEKRCDFSDANYHRLNVLGDLSIRTVADFALNHC